MSASGVLPIDDRVRQLISKLSPDEIARLIPQAKIHQLLDAQTARGRSAKVETTSKSSNTLKDRKKKKVNAFMAFRSYYSDIFRNKPQKERSPSITLLWQTDLFKPKWTIMANAYSQVRDFTTASSGRMPMSRFLRVACPIMGITKPADYLATFNWQFVPMNHNGQVILSLQQFQAPVIIDGVRAPTTELELLRACVQGGFLFKNSAILFRDMEGSSQGLMVQTVPTIVSAGKQQTGRFDKVFKKCAGTVAAVLPPSENLDGLDVELTDCHAMPPQKVYYWEEQTANMAQAMPFPDQEGVASGTPSTYPTTQVGFY